MNDRRRRWDFDKRIRENTIKALRAGARAAELGNEIDRCEWRERAKSYLEWLSSARASVVDDISSSRQLASDQRRRWCERLEDLDLTSPGARTELTDLLSEVQASRQSWTFRTGDIQLPTRPEWLTRLVPPTEWKPTVPPAPQETADPVELMLNRKEIARRREFQQQAEEVARVYAAIATSLEHMITLHQGYENARSRS